MISSTVFIINSPLHYLYCLSILKTIEKNDNYIILWFGKLPIENHFPKSDIIKEYNVIDLSHFDFNHYSGYKKNYTNFIELIKINVERIDYLFTCFDTHYGFEVLRNHFSVSWSHVGIIEDGIGNYFPNRMPKLRRQLPKAIINKLRFSFFLNVSRLNLGGNPKIGIVSALCPEHVYLHKDSKAEVLDIRRSFIEIINNYDMQAPAIYSSADVIFFLSAVLYYKRMTSGELIAFLEWVKSHNQISRFDNFVLKPHPREDLIQLKRIIKENFNNEIKVADNSPIEIYTKSISPKVLAGMPSTAILNHYLLNKNNETKYMLFPIRGLKFLDEQINVFKKIFLDNISLSYYN